MTDPGAFSSLQNEAKNISAVLITHEHQDHFHIDSLKKVLANNPEAVVITNTAVGRLLQEAGIKYTKIEEGERYEIGGVSVAGFGNLHAEIYQTYGQVQNTGYMIGNLCYPGDSFSYPDAHVDILALPVTGPWMKIKDALLYAKNINPRIVFPVHDGHIQEWASFIWGVPEKLLQELGIKFKKPTIGEEEEF